MITEDRSYNIFQAGKTDLQYLINFANIKRKRKSMM